MRPAEWRLAFWQWVHDRAEKLWHWTYYQRVRPAREALGLFPEASAPRDLLYGGPRQYSVTYVTAERKD